MDKIKMRETILSSLKKYAAYSILFIIPVLLVSFVSPIRQSLRPYYFTVDYENEYTYLLNSLSLAELHKVAFAGHPGTPLIMVGAITLRLSHLIYGKGALTEDVLRDPEFYLKIFNHALLALALLGLLLLGFLTTHVTKNVLDGLMVQAVVFLSELIPFYLARVSIETFLILPGLLYVGSIILMIKYDVKENPKLFIFLFSVIFGMGAAAKITFLPLILFPLVVLPRIRWKFYALIGSLCCFVIFTIPIIPEYPQLVSWLTALFLHTGIYGTGGTGIIDPVVFIHNIKEIFFSNQMVMIILLLSLILYGFIYIFTRKKPYFAGFRIGLILLGLLMAEGAQIVMVAKHYADRYLMPSIMLTIVNLLIIILVIREYLKQSDLYRPVGKIIFGCLQIMLVIYLIFQGHNDSIELTANYTPVNNEVATLQQKVGNEFADYSKVYYYASPVPEYALQIGNAFAGGAFSNQLGKIYGTRNYFWDVVRHKYSDWNQDITFKDIRARAGNKIIFVGLQFEYFKDVHGKPDLPLKDVFHGNSMPPRFPRMNYRIYLVELPKGGK